ncbi:PilZ domain-containing protein [Qipengyuania aurantiaca]|uniref:PilZ domain-containing protein n=1 Tax=Qipengyuania aurantiaca TaxID=2867233 RepID=A0ABX8ZV53_9SPHN|nr:PilZ domain-containing protein [Qipengyuania aurantiaca]QZD91023.1 PilZ domain-containing protein [Qipengyuania aurantiaca]
MNIERRIAERSSTRESVRIALGAYQLFGTMRNLSQQGCMVESPNAEVEVGDRCDVFLAPDYSVGGRIAWQLGDALGISFVHPVPESLVREFALDDWPQRAIMKRIGQGRG